MKLHDHGRPRIFHRPAFQTGMHVVPRLQIWPLGGTENDERENQVEISLMLPMLDTRFAAHWKAKTVEISEVPELISQFRDDPEKFVLDHFGIEINEERAKVSPPPPPAKTNGHAKEAPSPGISAMELLS